MQDYIMRFWDLIGVSHDPMMRNSVTLVMCIVLYGVFISREKDTGRSRTRRTSRCPDSILRGA